MTNKRFEDMNRRFEDLQKSAKDDIKMLIEMIDKKSEEVKNETKYDIKMLLEFMSARFEDMNKRFEDNKGYTDKKFETILRIMISFDIAILVMVIAMLLESLGIF